MLEDGKSLDLLRQEVEGDTLHVDYVTEVSLNDPEAVREDAAEILLSYAADEADAEGCSEIILGATDWLESGDARSLLITAIRDDDGNWRLR